MIYRILTLERIACVNFEKSIDELHGEACWIAGWGATNHAETHYPTMLKSAGVNVFGQDYCIEHTSVDGLNFDSICVGAPDNDDADELTQGSNNMCPGDSGGPLICPINGKATLVGATSL